MTYVNNGDSLETQDDIVVRGADPRNFIKNRIPYKGFDKKAVSNVINLLHKNYPLHMNPMVMDKIKDIGFEYCTKSAATISAFHVPTYTQ